MCINPAHPGRRYYQLIDLAMVYGAQAVEWSREYSWYSNEARNVTGRRRCQYAALAGAAKRKARTYAAMHNACLGSVRCSSVAGGAS